MVNIKQPESLMPQYFDALYAVKPDYWEFETREYEHNKYADTLRSLPRSHYKSVFEIGCSIGVLTAALAPRCDALLAVDGSAAPLETARARCADLPQVRVEQMLVPATFPDGPFDLILVSEVGYYWSPADFAQAQARILETLEPGGHLMLVHWTAPEPDYPLTGDEVHDAFLALPGLHHLHGHREEQYRLDVLERV